MGRYLKPLPAGRQESNATWRAGGVLRFSHCELIERDGAAVSRTLLPAGRAAEAAPELFRRLTAAPTTVAGLGLERARLLGVLNVTPDSFSDGGRYLAPERAVAHGERLFADGADLVDLGGESTRPGAAPVSTAEELARIMPVLERLVARGVPVCVDTRRAAVMRAAAAAGAVMLNDVSGLRFEPDAAAAVAASGLPLVLMHSRGEPGDMQARAVYAEVALDVFDELAQALDRAEAAGISRRRIVVDPGLGFAKTAQHNLALLAELAVLHSLGCPLLLGASRKRFIGRIAGPAEADRRLAGSLAALLRGRSAGAQLFRVHDVAESRQALALWDAIDGVGGVGGVDGEPLAPADGRGYPSASGATTEG